MEPVPSPSAAANPDTAAAASETTAALAELVAIVDRLRDPEGGCPWDLAQTHASLIPYALEEAHELADAIRHGDDRHLQEELGDLLLQVVLHARLAAERGAFDLAAVAGGIGAKLVRRHPHVFDPEAERHDDPEAVRRTWEAIKAAEREEKTAAGGETGRGGATAGKDSPSPLSDRLAEKVRGQPALAGAMTISRRAAAAGFEWEAMEGVWAKVSEEMAELREAVASGDREHAQAELGDVLFTLVNVARWCGLDPEEGLAGTNRRFLDRFSRVEAALGGDLGGRGIRELEGHWQAAKERIRAERGGRDSIADGATEAPGLSPPPSPPPAGGSS